MKHLSKIARSGTPGTGLQFCGEAYGSSGIRRFLRDVLAMANAAISGNRYIVTGINFDQKQERRINAITTDDFSGKPSYQSFVTDYIEPPVRIRYQPVSIDGKQVGVFEIGECQDKPYMMRADYSEKLRRGDAYVRVDNAAVKLGRRQLQEMFERKFRDSVSADKIEIGFPGEIIHKDYRVPVVDLSRLPSAIAGGKLQQMLETQTKSENSGATTVMARLTHARLFGSDSPYEERDAEELVQEMAEIRQKHKYDDEHFLFETHVEELQLVIYNQGSDAIENASLSLVMPNHNSFYVATRLPRILREKRWADRSPAEHAEYPAVNLKDDSVHVSNTLGDISADAPVQAFDKPLRICVGKELKGRKLGIRYTLFGSNLRQPAKGKLRLLF
jgi:schlafen family protein